MNGLSSLRNVCRNVEKVSEKDGFVRKVPAIIEYCLGMNFYIFFSVVVCGGKNVGKSTFIRYLINRHLMKWKRVLVLDFDPGQSEFTVMGCLSVVLVEQPLLGPNFSHILCPER